MGRIDNSGIREKILKSVQETERLMEQKKYNLSMIKARQTAEYIIKLQCDKAGIVEGEPDAMVRNLYDGKWISKATAEHYLQILAIGNRATKDGDNSSRNASQVFELLSEEAYAFTDSDRSQRARRSSAQAQAAPSRQAAQQRPQSPQRTASGQRARKQQSTRSRKKSSGSGLNSSDLLKLLIPIILVIVLVFLIRVLSPKKTPTNETTPPVTTEEVTTEPPTTAAPETTAPVETEPVIYKTTTTLNVRQGPSTDSSRIGKLDPGATVEYVRDYDTDWAVITYNGQEAYVSKQYLTEAAE